MKHHTKEFLKLQVHWDKKLADSGFVDAEQRDGNLKEWSSVFRLKHSDTALEAKQSYYRAAGQFLYTHKFTTFERQIWELHAQGVSIREIVVALNKKHRLATYKRQVHESLQSLIKIMLAEMKG